MRILVLCCIAFLALAADARRVSRSNVIDGEFIVVFKSTASESAVQEHMQTLRTLVSKRSMLKGSSSDLQDAGMVEEYSTVLRGYAARLDTQTLQTLRDRQEVSFVEPNRFSRIDYIQQNPANWGLSKIDSSPTADYITNATGCGVNVYVVDTGINYDYPDFEGRAFPFVDYVGNKLNGRDCNGHGTHVAGIIASKTYGVAKRANVHSVRVMNCDGVGSNAAIIAALDKIGQEGKRPAVVNMSLSGERSAAMDQAVKTLDQLGFTVVASAGNNNGQDACSRSPGANPTVITVGATTKSDTLAGYSNVGSCVDMLAPGSKVVSWWLKKKTVAKSGTSMSTPFVAGAAAVYYETNRIASPAQVANALISASLKSKVTGSLKGGANRLLQLPRTTPWTSYSSSATAKCGYPCKGSCPSGKVCTIGTWGDCRSKS